MNRRKFLSAVAVSSATFVIPGCFTQKSGQKPNLIFILADDLGYEDLSCFNSKMINTPHIDQLAASGMKFTHFYSASAVCSPTRASCLTGRYPLRFSITRHFTDHEEHLPRGTVTLPKMLQQAGYRTAHIGKWHLGGLNKKHCENREASIPGPNQHGFDEYVCMYEDPAIRAPLLQARRLYREGAKYLVSNDKALPPIQQHWTEYKVERSRQFIVEAVQAKQPFFLNLWFDAPHTPYEPAPEPYLNPYKKRAKGDDLWYRSMVAQMDNGIGKIISKLKQLKIEQNTFIIFTSDNGPSHQGCPGPWTGGKADLHEGGIRVPMIAGWPGTIKSESVTTDVAHTNDLLPTFVAAAGLTLPPDLEIDGINLFPALSGKGKIPAERTLFWQLDLYEWYPQPGPKPKPFATEIARQGKWKLLAANGTPLALFNMEEDPYERRNLIEVWPERAHELTQSLNQWLNEPRQKWENQTE